MVSNGNVIPKPEQRRTSVATISDRVKQKGDGLLIDLWNAYKLQIIWLTIFIISQLFFFGMGVLRYFKDFLPTIGQNHFNASSMIGFATGMVLQVDCTILLFLPAYRWTTGLLRRTFIARVFPFDSAISFHVILGFVVGGVTIAHVVSFVVGFYYASKESGFPLTSFLFKSGIIGADFLGGYTTISGWIILSCLVVMTFFALPPMRKCNFDVFYWTHKLQLVFWAGLIVHAPHIWKFMVVPLVLYFVEKLHKYVNAFRWRKISKIVQVNLLPLDVVHLVIKRPKDFKYNPGDYCFLKIPLNGIFSWHPFTLSSCPEQEDHIWFHIKASGNYTQALTSTLGNAYTATKSQQPTLQQVVEMSSDPTALQPKVPTLQSIPNLNVQVFLDGPYGASTTALFQTKHAVLIGGGIGVTPFASILGSVLTQFRQQRVDCPNCQHTFQTTGHSMQINHKQLKLKKLDFIWVCKEAEQIQWFIDLLHGWEEEQRLLPSDDLFMSCHIYLTRKLPTLSPKVLDTNMSGIKTEESVFGLQTEMRTGRPKWNQVFHNIEKNKNGSVRVFFCGPSPMERELRRLCGRYQYQFSWENF